MNPVSVAVLGVGSLGQHHARIYHELEGARLVGVMDADRERAQRFADDFGCKVFHRVEEMQGEVEACSLVVPTDLHHDMGLKVLGMGIHVLIEKPIATTTAEAEDLVRLAQDKNLILQVGHIERFNPVLSVVENWPKPPRFIEAHRLANYPPPREGMLPRGTEVSVVLDLMIHDIEVLLHLVDSPVVDLRAVGLSVLSPSEDICNVRIEFENGCVANVTASRISPERMRKIRVFFEDAYVSLDYQDQSGVLHRKSATGISREELGIEKGDALTNELASFVSCVRDHGQPRVTGAHAAEALKLATRITRMIRESRT